MMGEGRRAAAAESVNDAYACGLGDLSSGIFYQPRLVRLLRFILVIVKHLQGPLIIQTGLPPRA